LLGTGTVKWLLVAALLAAGAGKNDYRLEPSTAADFEALRARAVKDGLSPFAFAIRSAYRPAPEQNPLAGEVIRAFGEKELTHWIASKSEHITGRSIDLDLGIPSTITNAETHGYDHLTVYKWLRVHAREFGFNQAFPGEPWHITHNLVPGTTEGAEPGVVLPGRAGTVVLPPPDGPFDHATSVLTGDAVAWRPGSSTIVYTQCWREEGGGDGCVVKVESRDGTVAQSIPVFLPGEADDKETRKARIAKAHGAVAPLVESATMLQGQPWDSPSYPTVVGGGLELGWDSAAKALSLPGKPPLKVKQIDPWGVRPFQVYADPTLDFLVVDLLYDPVEAFTQGANLVSRFMVVPDVVFPFGPNWRKGLPADVVALVERFGGCNHWGGEEGYSPARRKEIDNGARKLGCGRLDADVRRLQAKYARKPRIVELISAAHNFGD
jgi:D-alanyl-D-alanine carboxypeptidase